MQQSECEKLLLSLKDCLETEFQKADKRRILTEQTGETYEQFYAYGKMAALQSAIIHVLDCLSKTYRQQTKP